MSDDFSQKMKQITDMLGKEGMPENLMGLLSTLVSNANMNSDKKENPPEKENKSQADEQEKPVRENSGDKSVLMDDIEMAKKIRRIMGGFQNTTDPRINLMKAITPFLNNSRQQKVANCIRLFEMTNLTRFVAENEKNLPQHNLQSK
jgi:hypothetical protein